MVEYVPVAVLAMKENDLEIVQTIFCLGISFEALDCYRVVENPSTQLESHFRQELWLFSIVCRLHEHAFVILNFI